MTINEVKQDLFTVPDCYYAHCISDDFALGAGIAVEFNKRFDMRNKLREKHPNGYGGAGCVLIDNTFNLITKEKCYYKSTLKNIEIALQQMCDVALKENVTRIAMPKIGCGLDRQKWEDVKQLIINTFENTDIKIIVCYL